MAKLTRVLQKVFGESGATAQFGQFGSLAAGSPVTTKDPTTIQALSNYLGGWFSAVLGGNSPAIEDMNALHFLQTRQLAYLFQAGIAEWETGTTYYIGSLASVAGIVYESITDDNLGNAVTDITKWKIHTELPVVVATANGAILSNRNYIMDKVTVLEADLPATSVVGDRIKIIGKGAGGWELYSNAAATTQQVVRTDVSSQPSASSRVALIKSLTQYDCIELECVVSDSIWVVVNSEGGEIVGSNYYGDASDGDVVIGANTNLISTLDGDMVVKNYNNLTVQETFTLSVSNRCKGMLLYVKGNLTLDGIISMTGKGANVDPVSAGVSANGLGVKRFKTGSTDTDPGTDLMQGAGTAAIAAENNQAAGVCKVYYITRAGAAGGAAVTDVTNGNNGTSGGTGQSGGGGSGASNENLTSFSGAGGVGTCFSGGSGGGAICALNGGTTGNPGSSVGGAGGAGALGGTGQGAGGGAGNPGGAAAGSASAGEAGTGGTIIIIVRGDVTIGSNGKIESKGAAGGAASGGSPYYYDAGGAGSGGGAVLLLYAGAYSVSGSLVTDGGAGGIGLYGPEGGNGGAGDIQVSQINR
jgi:hypothetical protein